jgi:Protein of unknown function (DUF2911)
MARDLFRFLTPLAAAAFLAVLPVSAQTSGGLTLPPSGDNQRASVTQGIGLVDVTIRYSSPDVHGPEGEDRRGKIWGGLVPWGPASHGFTCGEQCPWRGGANENTVFTTTHDVKVQGQPLPAGSYGLHFIADSEEWTVIFSKNHTAWGSYYYDPKDDALRVKAKPEKSEYTEWLTYEFTDRRPDRATVALEWEDLKVPFTITVDGMVDLYVENLRRELQTEAGFSRENRLAAAQYCLENGTNLEEALGWAQLAAGEARQNWVSFQAVTTLAELQVANGKTEEGRKSLDRALALPGLTAPDVHQYGRQLQARKRYEEAMRVFETNAKRFPGVWPVHVGLARGHFGLGRKKEALEEARLALKQAPDEAARKGVETLIRQIEGGS